MQIVSRQEAIAAGSDRYYTGQPCKRGHLALRNTKTKVCCDCLAHYNSVHGPAARRKYNASEQGKAARSAQTRRYLDKPEARVVREKRRKERLATDPQFAIATSLRSRLKAAIQRGFVDKKGSAVSDLGMTLPEFKAYCEAHPNWQPDWTWAGLGTVFQLDHIKPLGLFDLTDAAQLKKAVHYTNLQPLSVADHKVKTATDVQMIQARAQVQSLSL